MVSRVINKKTAQYALQKILMVIRGRPSIYLGDFQALTKLSTGQPFFVDTRDISLTPTILLTGKWEPSITSFFKKLVKPGMTIIDVGSHMGYYSILSGALVGNEGKVYAFEANPTIFNTLFKNIFVNGFVGRVIPNQLAVYSHSDTLRFNVLKRASGGNSIVEFTEGYKEIFQENVTTINVQSISLDEYFSTQGSYQVDIIKIDAEGSEPFIFRGMRKILQENQDIKIFCEFNAGLIRGCGNDPVAFLEDLHGLGFRLSRIISKNETKEISIENLIQLGEADLLLQR